MYENTKNSNGVRFLTLSLECGSEQGRGLALVSHIHVSLDFFMSMLILLLSFKINVFFKLLTQKRQYTLIVEFLENKNKLK